MSEDKAKEQFTRMLEDLQDGEFHIIELEEKTEGGEEDESVDAIVK